MRIETIIKSKLFVSLYIAFGDDPDADFPSHIPFLGLAVGVSAVINKPG